MITVVSVIFLNTVRMLYIMDVTSVLFELICIRGGYFNLDFDDSEVRTFIDFICRH